MIENHVYTYRTGNKVSENLLYYYINISKKKIDRRTRNLLE